MKTRVLVVVLLLCVSAAIIGCGEVSHDVDRISVLKSIRITPSSVKLMTNSVEAFSATGFDQYGATYTISPFWNVTGDIGTITAAGVFTAGNAGEGSVTAGVRDIIGTATVTCTGNTTAELSTILVYPTSATLNSGSTQTFTATAYYSDGTAATISPAWSVEGGSGSISGAGVFSAILPGQVCTVVASFSGKRGTAVVTVSSSTTF